ncbi:MAG: hypothetical protein FWD95_18295, partial [Nocardioidaceae bacterium]|nr:hypothetical protein [Nocardioidaceae bacterium]
DGPVVVEGGWEYWPGRPMGEPWTGVAAIEPTGPADVPVAAVRLPWTWATETPTAGLPMLSDAADRQARRHLDRVGADVGLWLDHRGALCASTAGAVLVRAADGAWLRPDDASAPPSSWAYEQACEAVAARRTTLDGAVLASASIIRVVDELGGLLRIV